jgi:Uma2 family endonuclease
VEKPKGFFESRLAVILVHFLEGYLERNNLGITLGPDALLGIEPGQVRLPDVSFYFWDRFPNRTFPRGAILKMVPDFAVEILSPSNTKKEMNRKGKKYFDRGTKLVWQVHPDKKIVEVFTEPMKSFEIGTNQILKGDPVLPGFSLSISDWFGRAGKVEE